MNTSIVLRTAMSGNLHFLLILALGSHCIPLISAQILKLQKENCSTKCTHGLINLQDYCQVNVVVQFNESVPSSTIIYFEQLGKKDQNIFSIDIPSECTGQKPNANNYCTQLNNTTFNVTAIMKAKQSFSNVHFRYYITLSNGKRRVSDILTFPETQDATNLTVRMSINDDDVLTTDNCTKTVDKNYLDLKINFSSVALPCWVEIQINGSVVYNKKGTSFGYNQSLINEEKLSMKISYGPCSPHVLSESFTCTIKQGTPKLEQVISVNDGSKPSSVVIIITPILVGIVSIFFISLILVCRFCKPKKCREKTENCDNGNFINNDENTEEKSTETELLMEIVNKDKDVENGHCVIAPTVQSSQAEESERSTESSPLLALKTLNPELFVVHVEPEFKVAHPDIPNGSVRTDSVKNSRLICVIVNNQFDVAEALIKKGVDVNKADKNNKTPLMYACEKNNIVLCALLLEYGALVNEQIKQSKSTALMIACKNGSKEIVKMLLGKKEINLESKNMSAHTALIIACKNGHCHIAKILIENKSNIDALDSQGYSPLMHAFENGFVDVVLLLINNGANVSIKSNDGNTALAIYQKSGNKSEEIDKLLRGRIRMY